MTDEKTPLPQKEKRHRVTAGLLALFLGWLGIHKFYLRQYGWGLLYLFFFETGIPFLAGIVEGIIFFTMPEADFDEKYNTVQPIEIHHPKKTAAFLAFFLGCFGAHKFYLRDTGWGVVYLLATVTGFYLSYQALDAAGFSKLIDSMIQSNADLRTLLITTQHFKMTIEGLFWPSLLGTIPTLAGIVDGFVLLNMSNERFKAKYHL